MTATPPPPEEPQTPPERDFVAEYRAREKEQRETGQWQKLSGAGIEFAVAIGLGALAGWGVDEWLETGPWGLIVGVFLGFILGLFILFRLSKDAFK